jgi:hypothetical protein
MEIWPQRSLLHAPVIITRAELDTLVWLSPPKACKELGISDEAIGKLVPRNRYLRHHLLKARLRKRQVMLPPIRLGQRSTTYAK